MLDTAIRTLSAAGFLLNRVERGPSYALVLMSRVDEFGCNHNYCFAISDGAPFDGATAEAIKIPASQFAARPIFVGPSAPATERCLGYDDFLSVSGGPILTALPTSNDYRAHILELSVNRLPPGFSGKADTHFETYIREGLSFAMGIRTIRYGQERLFEARTDGIVLSYQNFAALYDAKAYANGYPVSQDSMRQFKSYVDDFRTRYNYYVPLKAFLVISGSFEQGSDALDSRSKDFIAQAQIPLAFLTAETLCDIIALLKDYPAARRSIDWTRVFADAVVQSSRVKQELNAVLKDQIIPK